MNKSQFKKHLRNNKNLAIHLNHSIKAPKMQGEIPHLLCRKKLCNFVYTD